ncbi:hypothetical protein MWU38_03740 [Qipengyuania sp. S6317L1]|uniref:hypothetical protein n=1 Tax=Qipengyuania sp. S6317L1 TaxID=2926410 RepID=UPI001FF12BA7|nr:hypothetical protein [Qipengyuania sp. S6317L1]MCK0098488.1 hypothetical protein [Qipengyuania sp. S6317L1]
MPAAEAVAMIFVCVAFFAGCWGIIDSVLKHRRKMFEMKHEHGAAGKTLTHENTELRETVSLMQDRIAVLEQIATDPARRTADEIEKLR